MPFELVYDLAAVVGMIRRAKYGTAQKLQSELSAAYGAHTTVAFQWVIAVWSDYCDISWEDVVDKRSFELIQLLNLYVMCFDRIADNPSGMIELVKDPYFAKHNPELKPSIYAISNWILCSKMSTTKKLALLATIQHFRHESLSAYQYGFRLQLEGNVSIETIFLTIEGTTGLWLKTYTKILNIIHDVPDPVACRIEALLYRFAAMGQLFDDAVDYANDLKDGALNLVDAALRDHPSERHAAETLFQTPHRVWGWLPTVAPETYVDIKRFFVEQLALLESIDPNSLTTRYLRQVSTSLFRLSIVHRILPDALQRGLEAVKMLVRR